MQVTTTADTCAELVNDPKRPNTNPAMAIAAMSVIAIRITVARTGEIAFRLFFPYLKFIAKVASSLILIKSYGVLVDSTMIFSAKWQNKPSCVALVLP